jgi:hypothetical protein
MKEALIPLLLTGVVRIPTTRSCEAFRSAVHVNGDGGNGISPAHLACNRSSHAGSLVRFLFQRHQ